MAIFSAFYLFLSREAPRDRVATCGAPRGEQQRDGLRDLADTKPPCEHPGRCRIEASRTTNKPAGQRRCRVVTNPKRRHTKPPVDGSSDLCKSRKSTSAWHEGARRRSRGGSLLSRGSGWGRGRRKLFLSRLEGCDCTVAGLQMQRQFEGCGNFRQPFSQSSR